MGKDIWGTDMAKLILTGMHEAIDLKALRGEQVLKLDQVLTQSPEGDAFWLVGVRGRVLQFLRLLTCKEFIPLKPRRTIPTA
jgi:hypothetical protein